tara:strand:+ start:3829 stop:3984 length:156 start_codon:yes stop_codon:yes gene_type:complete
LFLAFIFNFIDNFVYIFFIFNNVLFTEVLQNIIWYPWFKKTLPIILEMKKK